MSDSNDRIEQVGDYLRGLQSEIVQALESVDGKATFRSDRWDRPGGGGGYSRVLVDGGVFEQAGVGFSHVFGEKMPPSATKSRPELEGKSFQALGVSLVLHPRNPYAPTTHATFRFFATDGGDNGGLEDARIAADGDVSEDPRLSADLGMPADNSLLAVDDRVFMDAGMVFHARAVEHHRVGTDVGRRGHAGILGDESASVGMTVTLGAAL